MVLRVGGVGFFSFREEDLDCGQEFHNPYEQSKWAAEQCLRQARNLRVTVYRPAVIVGDSRTGGRW